MTNDTPRPPSLLEGLPPRPEGGIYLDNERPETITLLLRKERSYMLKVGKRKFYRIEPRP